MSDSASASSDQGLKSTPLFELEGVSASRDGRPILTGLDVRIAEGATAVVGPSGAGKSTLLRLLNRLADPDEGAVRFRGAEVRSLDPLELRRRACLVPQVPAPLPATVAANVALGPRLAGRRADVSRCLDLCGLEPSYAERSAERLSVGEQQRVMLARALALEPEVLLLDEPTSALDPESRAGVERTLAELRKQTGVSTVLVTHDRGQADRLGDRILELRGGRAGELQHRGEER